MILYNLALPAITIVDVIDILVVSLLIYQLYKLIKGSVAVKIFLGFLLTYFIARLAIWYNMRLLGTLLKYLVEMGGIVCIVTFQYEIRKFFASIGALIFFRIKILTRLPKWQKQAVLSSHTTAIVDAAKILGGSNMGGLIVLTHTEDLKFYIESGDLLNACISKRLLLAIFNKESPLHDGAVVIYEDKVVAARCILPITERQNLPAQLGLRHRAAIGMSDVTDTLVIVISEETGQIAVARKGVLDTNLSIQELRMEINTYFKEG